METDSVPQHATILVVGGGPAGSYAASLLQREGIQVVLLEAATFPRYHVGESMLPALRTYIRFIGVEDDFVNHGFTPKPGACFKLVQGVKPSWTDFLALGPSYGTWNVIRSEMDDILLQHAAKEGVIVCQETKVDSLDFADERPISAQWTKKSGQCGKITFDWMIDASGRVGLMSMKYLNNRVMRDSLRNIAMWGYWKNAKVFGDGTPRAGGDWFEALTDQKGWAWLIPLHNGTTSIGFVMHQTAFNAKKSTPKLDGENPTLTELYLDQIQYAPGVADLIGDRGTFIEGSVKSGSDFSYFASRYSGDHFRIIGDAANFVDPFFSSGVSVAIMGALSAAITIMASMKGQVTEYFAQTWHDEKVGIAHTRFLFVVLCAYRQMHLHDVPLLSDISEDNFDHAFDMFRPVIFGLADSDTKLTSAKVQSMMDVLQPMFDPHIDDANVKSVAMRYGVEHLSMESAVLGPERIHAMAKEDEEAQRVLKKFDALKLFGEDVEVTYLGRHPLLGYRANMIRGELGLKKNIGDNDHPNGESLT